MTTAPAHVLGRPVWFELMTTDTQAAEAFYDKVIGWTSEPFHASPNPYTQFKRSGGMMNKPAEMAKAPPHWAIWIVNAMDPQGASFALHAPKTA
jgi:predicted enzyme related to lactoylglutathione lyase